jgi:hypothetical protein
MEPERFHAWDASTGRRVIREMTSGQFPESCGDRAAANLDRTLLESEQLFGIDGAYELTSGMVPNGSEEHRAMVVKESVQPSSQVGW